MKDYISNCNFTKSLQILFFNTNGFVSQLKFALALALAAGEADIDDFSSSQAKLLSFLVPVSLFLVAVGDIVETIFLNSFEFDNDAFMNNFLMSMTLHD